MTPGPTGPTLASVTGTAPPPPRQRVLLLEDDPMLRDVLGGLFADEDIDVTDCASLAELRAGAAAHPSAVVVSDSWARDEHQALSDQHRAEIAALARAVPVVLTSGRTWALRAWRSAALGPDVTVLGKPYRIDALLEAIAASAGARRRA